MSVKLEWVPAIEASDRRKAGWIEIELHGGIEAAPGCFLMASPGEEVAQQTKPEDQALVVCPNCGNLTSESHAGNYLPWICTKPEPAATVEMPEFRELDDRHNRMASSEYQAKVKDDMDRRAVEIGGDRLVGVSYRPVSETVAVGTWQLEELLKYADLAEVALRTGFHPPEFLFRPADRSLRQVIDAVKKQRDEQRTHAQPVGITEELESVLRSAKEYEMAVRTGTRVEWHAYDADRIGAAIAAVRSQYRRKG